MTARTEPLKLTPPWKAYRRKGHSEMRPYVLGEDLKGVSVSDVDAIAMSAARLRGRDPGGYIARNPKNHADQWYVAQAYFDENLEPADVVARDDAAELRAALLAICEDAPEEAPDWYEGDNHGDTAGQAADREHYRLAQIARAALAATEGSE